MVLMYAEDVNGIEVMCEWWGVSRSTLCWALVHDWLRRVRGWSVELGEARGALRGVLEVALRDGELGPWLRAEVMGNPHGVREGE